MRAEIWLKTDLQQGVEVIPIKGNLFSGDVNSNLVGVEVYDNGYEVELDGQIYAYIIRADGATVTLSNGTTENNRASIILTRECYAVPGAISIVIKCGNITVGACHGFVYQSSTDAIVDPGNVIPSLSELLAQIDDCKAATDSANTAASGATAAKTAAETAAESANAAAQSLEGMTATATDSLPGADAKVAVSKTDGKYNLAFTIPRGQPGPANTIIQTWNEYADGGTNGTTPPSSGWQETPPTVASGQYMWTRIRWVFAFGQSAVVYVIARQGVDGSGAVSMVQGISPNASGNVTLDPLLATENGVIYDVDSIFTAE